MLKDTSAEITRGDKIAFIGANGKGKSTLLRMISNEETFEGNSEDTYNVVPSFYAQHQLESLDTENDALRELQVFAPEETDTYLRSLLGAFLLKGDDVFKKIKVLSGGERARVALAKTILARANFLLLDEPTNHLDMQSVNVLVEVLNKYEGTYIVVSHDRYFLSRIANKIWYIENKELKEYPGTYEEFETWQRELKQQKEKPAPVPKKEKAPEPVKQKKETPKVNKHQLETQVKKWEGELDKARKKFQLISDQMSDPEVYKQTERFKKLQQDYDKAKLAVEHAEKEWEAYYLKLIELNES